MCCKAQLELVGLVYTKNKVAGKTVCRECICLAHTPVHAAHMCIIGWMYRNIRSNLLITNRIGTSLAEFVNMCIIGWRYRNIGSGLLITYKIGTSLAELVNELAGGRQFEKS